MTGEEGGRFLHVGTRWTRRAALPPESNDERRFTVHGASR